ncbi:beta-galactosidase GalB [Pelagicoccus mobilis]|uniref:Glycoside hydrolase family 2 protein n=1 Tax=Pelagicoccus mobilis TaxID=415221 RepID=A0A934RVM5_9BACT|nr:beta-galactosidase GalB [Pelagicoccus mobilis]MBK1875262.1 glycoside hydrolase family 2 protein [Pelagicoccus mobilis]
MNNIGTFLKTTVVAFLALGAVLAASARERVSFNDSWRFAKGDQQASGASFDDRDWRELRLPHDWAIEGPYDFKYNARTGGLPVVGEGWYRKSFQMPKSAKGKVVSIEFDGAMYGSEVYVNGKLVGKRPYGYIGFQYDISKYLIYGDKENVVAVRLVLEDLATRWYSGAGLYRNVWLQVTEPTRVAHWGTFIKTPEVSDHEATVEIDTRIAHAGRGTFKGSLETEIFDADGRRVASVSSDFATSEDEKTLTQLAKIRNPRRWDTEDPHRYRAISRVRNAKGQTIDFYETMFGVRTIEYTAEQGFLLNGKQTKFKGVCLHHDQGPLGAAVNYRAKERQLQIMKDMGVNAIRTSHNPPSIELLELCDKMGLLVQDESFDVWKIAKVENGYNKFWDEWHEPDLRDMIKRDRNHPSIVMWSIGNEILEQRNTNGEGAALARRLVDICKEEDDTRPVTAGLNHYPQPHDNGFAEELDLVGINYKPSMYAEVLEKYPDRIVYGSETSSCVSSRGVYHLPIEKYEKHESLQVTSYDLIGPVWAYPPDIEFHFQEQNPRIMGEFIWTGFDYLGEPTPYGGRDNSTNGHWNGDWPVHSSFFGAVDLCGFPKDRFFLYQSQWSDKPMVHVLPHWNWEGMEGETIPVYGYTNCDEAELFLNGRSLGRKVKGVDTTRIIVKFKRYDSDHLDSKYRLSWEVPYEPGELTIVGYKAGQEVSRKTVRTAGKPAGVRLTADRSVIAADGKDLSFITVQVVDENGIACPTADNEIHFDIQGGGVLAAVGNGNPASLESFRLPKRKAFSGKALLVVRGKPGASGLIDITASGEGLDSSRISISLEN